jgi:hypothetical protein
MDMLKKIKVGKIHLNKTLLCLMPGFKVLGEEFNNHLKQLYVVGAFIEHENLESSAFSFKSLSPVFIVVDKLFRPKETEKMLAWFSYQSFYLGCYSLINTDYFDRYFVLILSHPNKKAYKYFLEHQFSKMYTRKEIEDFFNVPLLEETKKYLLKEKEAIQKHIELIENTFNTKITVSDVLHQDYQLLIGNKEQETLN